jgi:hypothetical protein
MKRLRRVILTSMGMGALALILSTCASILTEDVVIKGSVRLSDNPAGGPGGVEVVAGDQSVLSRPDGTYRISAEVMGETKLAVVFQREGYVERRIEIDVPYPAPEGKSVGTVDMGTVVLQRRS